MSAISNFIASASTSLIISGIGWYLLERRSNKTSKRSESFSLLAPTIALLSEFQKMAEDNFNTPNLISLSGSNFIDNGTEIVNHQQIFEIKFHSKFKLLRAKLSQLESRNICIPNNNLILLRQAFTLSAINTPLNFQEALHVCHRIEIELYQSYEREHNGHNT